MDFNFTPSSLVSGTEMLLLKFSILLGFSIVFAWAFSKFYGVYQMFFFKDVRK